MIAARRRRDEVVGHDEAKMPCSTHGHEFIDVVIGVRRDGRLHDVRRRGGVLWNSPLTCCRPEERNFRLRAGQTPPHVRVVASAPGVLIRDDIGDKLCKVIVAEDTQLSRPHGRVSARLALGQNLHGSRRVPAHVREQTERVSRRDSELPGELFQPTCTVGQQSLQERSRRPILVLRAGEGQ